MIFAAGLKKIVSLQIKPLSNAQRHQAEYDRWWRCE
jgi:hypothetical protein